MSGRVLLDSGKCPRASHPTFSVSKLYQERSEGVWDGSGRVRESKRGLEGSRNGS